MLKGNLSVKEEAEVTAYIDKLQTILTKKPWRKTDSLMKMMEQENKFWRKLGHFEPPTSPKLRQEIKQRAERLYGVQVRFNRDDVYLGLIAAKVR